MYIFFSPTSLPTPSAARYFLATAGLGVLLATLCSCSGTWLPHAYSSADKVYPVKEIRQIVQHAPPGSFRQKRFTGEYGDVFGAVASTAQQLGCIVEESDIAEGNIVASCYRSLAPPPDLLNCPNNRFANTQQQKWKYFIGVHFTHIEPLAIEVQAAAKVQGRCYSGGGCYGADPCPEYASVRWAVGYGSGEDLLTQLLSHAERELKSAQER